MRTLWEYTLPTSQVLRVCQGDITEQTTEAIVNAANERLEHGGGVAGAIRKRGGKVIQEESRSWIKEHGLVHTGSAAITSAGKLPAKFVIHAVGPVWGTGEEERKLTNAVESALAIAEGKGIRSISIPGISSGIFGGPKDVCARIIIQTTLDHFRKNPNTNLREVNFCNIDNITTSTFLEEAKQILNA